MTENVFRWEVDSPPDLHQPRMRVQVVWVEEYDKLLRENQRLQREVDAFLAAKGKASEPSEVRPPVKLEDHGPVIEEVAPVSKEAWDALKSSPPRDADGNPIKEGDLRWHLDPPV